MESPKSSVLPTFTLSLSGGVSPLVSGDRVKKPFNLRNKALLLHHLPRISCLSFSYFTFTFFSITFTLLSFHNNPYCISTLSPLTFSLLVISYCILVLVFWLLLFVSCLGIYTSAPQCREWQWCNKLRWLSLSSSAGPALKRPAPVEKGMEHVLSSIVDGKLIPFF